MRHVLVCLSLLLLAGCGDPPSEETAVPAAPAVQEPVAAVPAPPVQATPEPPSVQRPAADPIRPLHTRGQEFVDGDGHPLRFWGVNLCAVYPVDQAHADGIAAALADRGINLVRPHHLLRMSRDWAPDLAGGSLALYKDDSRTLDPVALDRFDRLNAALRRQGIYLMFSAHWTRSFLPGDAAILPDAADAAEWQAAVRELRAWPWQKSFDPTKMLPVFDERAARLVEESVRAILGHVNPYTGLAYGADPQVLTYECVNEFTSAYTIICGNRFPAWFEHELQARWEAHAAKVGLVAGDLWKPKDQTVALERARFLRALDEAWMHRLGAVVRDAGCQAPIAFTNLWRGDDHQAMESAAGYSENHCYADPMVAGSADDLVRAVGRSAMADKPFIIGELNQSEGERGKAEAPYRSMLPLAAAAYGAFQDWGGIAWFAWNHGNQQRPVGSDGWAVHEGRAPAIGSMVGDGVMLDHLRTAGIIFRRGLVARSRQPITVTVPEPWPRADYNGLMAGSLQVRPGWQSVHGVRYAYGPAPEGQALAPWLTADAPSPLVSDTGEIRKDTARRQLTIAAPAAEAFSGMLDATAPAGLRVLAIDGDGFATVILVADDGQPLATSGSMVLSRTASRADGGEGPAPALRLAGLAAGTWWLRITRPRDVVPGQLRLERAGDGTIALPAGAWHEAELRRTR